MLIEEIRKDWLMGGVTDYTDHEILEGFSSIERFLDQDFIVEKWRGQRGRAVANQIIELGLNLQSISHIPGFDKLIKRLTNKSTYGITTSELACAVPFVKTKLLVELYPTNPDKLGELEMRLQTPNNKSIYVEVVSPKTQVWERFLLKIVPYIQKIVSRMKDIRLEIYSYRLLNQNELVELYGHCKKIISEGKIGSEIHSKNKYHIFLSHADTIKINKVEKKTDEQATLFVTNLVQVDGHRTIVTVGLPFADKRAEEVLEGEYHQLTTNFANIIVIDLSGVPKGMKNWPSYIKRRLQPALNRKISAVMLRASVNSKRIESEYVWIINSYANHKVDTTFSDIK